MTANNSYVASLDIGTSTVRCYIFDSLGIAVGKAETQVEILYPKPGYAEIEAEQLWNNVVFVMKKAIQNSDLVASDIKCLGISSQRCTFATWNKFTGKLYHNFITWSDLRASSMVEEANSSLFMKTLRLTSKILFGLSGSKRFLAGSVVKFMNAQAAVRLLWVLKNIKEVSKGIEDNDVLFGTIDTWILFKLSNGLLHVTDFSCASPTGFFDPFTLKWANWALNFLGIPESILPRIVDSAGAEHFGVVDSSILGASIPITASIADQSAALFGSRCFNVGDMKITLGTGTFIDVNTGSEPETSMKGVYPIIGWKYKDELVYLAEASSNDTGTLTKWAVDFGLVNNICDSSNIALSIEDNGGVYFVPAFSGMQAPINDISAGSGFIGVKPSSGQAHFLRAILESIAYRVAHLYDLFVSEMNFSTYLIKVDGGVSQNDFITQFLADLTNVSMERAESSEMSVLGAAYLAGLAQGVWKDKEELCSLERITNEYKPTYDSHNKYKSMFSIWRRAVTRFGGWYAT